MTAPVSDDLGFVIEHDDQRMVVGRRGAALQRYSVGGVDVIDGVLPDEVPGAFDGVVLAPWPNRVRDGAWTLDGLAQQLPINEPEHGTALHGLVLWADWSPVAAGADRVTLAYRLHARPGYPFELDLSVAYELTPDGLRCTMSATNRSATAAPYGCSVHPFIGNAGTRVDAMRLRLPAGSWLATDERLLPTEVRTVEGTEADLTGGPSLDGIVLDTAFTDIAPGPDGLLCAHVDLGALGHQVEMWADPDFGWWQVYTGDAFAVDDSRHRRSVAVEPMTCPPDAFNSGTDLIWLEPDRTWSAAWGLRVTVTQD